MTTAFIAWVVVSGLAGQAGATDAPAPVEPEASPTEVVPAPVDAPSVPSATAASSTDEEDSEVERPKVLFLDLDAADVPPGQAKVINGLITDGLGQFGSIELITQQDIRTLADLESQRASLGCDDTSCLAEIASAMGATYVVFGSIGRLGSTTIVQLNLFDSDAAKAIERQSARSQRIEELPADVEAALILLVGGLITDDERDAAQKRVVSARNDVPPEPEGSEADEAEDGAGLSWAILGTGMGVAGGGILALLGGAWGAWGLSFVISEPTVPGLAKDASFVAGGGLMVLSVAGAIATVGGVGVVGYAFVE